MLRPLLFAALVAASSACTSPDQPGQTEPVAPADETTPYPEDPDMAKGGGELDQPEDTGSKSGEAVGELTDDPFKNQSPAAEGTPPSDADLSEDGLPIPDEGEPYGGTFEEPQPGYEPSPDQGKVVPPVVAGDDFATPPALDDAPPANPKKPGKGKAGKLTKAPKGKTTRYVNAVLLNVRGKPTTKSKVVRRLLGGAKIYVQIGKGGWAKIRDGQWVRTSFLSSAPTRRVSRAEADKAWQKKYKKRK
jgi:hypothetical protein